jgi:hypothetical protein
MGLRGPGGRGLAGIGKTDSGRRLTQQTPMRNSAVRNLTSHVVSSARRHEPRTQT